MNRLGQKRKLFFAAVALVLSIILCLSGRGRVSLAASETSEISNASTEGLYLDDGAGLLTEEEEGSLKKTLRRLCLCNDVGQLRDGIGLCKIPLPGIFRNCERCPVSD